MARAENSDRPAVPGYGAVWRIAWPIILANSAVPLLGLADTAIIGNVGGTVDLAAIALGALIFNFLYWGFGFLRMGTTGLTAQAAGARDEAELRSVLGRALLIGGAIGAGLWAGQGVLTAGALALLQADAAVETAAAGYVAVRIWGAPAALAVYGVLGWFIGLKDSRTVLILQVTLNGLNIALDILFAAVLGWGLEGVAAGTALAEWLTAGVAAILVVRRLRTRAPGRSGWAWSRLTAPGPLLNTLAVNGDIFIRTLFLILGFAWFTNASATFGPTALAANYVLLQFLAVSSYLLDGFAFAAEALVGEAVGARNRPLFQAALRRSSVMALAGAAGLTVLFLGGGPLAIDALTSEDNVRSAAKQFLVFAALQPVIAVACFQLDGIFIGATRTGAMRNAMMLSFAAYLGASAALTPWAGNAGLWTAFLIFFAARGVTLGAALPWLTRSLSEAGHISDDPPPPHPRPS